MPKLKYSSNTAVIQKRGSKPKPFRTPSCLEKAPIVRHFRVAILEDNAGMRTFVSRALEKEYTVVFASNGSDLRDLIWKGAVHVVVLDIGLPDEDGISIAKDIRTMSQIPIVFLSGNSSAEMIVKGLNIGGDDYLTKPVSSPVLLARVANALRRAASLEQSPEGVVKELRIGAASLDARRRVLKHPDRRFATLTDLECRLLAALAQRVEQVVSREDLTRRIYGQDWNPASRSIDVHLTHLRKKLKEVGGANHTITSIRGVGFRLDIGNSK